MLSSLARPGRSGFGSERTRGLSLTTGRNDSKQVPPTAPRHAARPHRLKVSELLQGEQEAILEHGGHDYRLRITSTGKLILTK
jgi:hemin uptake protein HemP